MKTGEITWWAVSVFIILAFGACMYGFIYSLGELGYEIKHHQEFVGAKVILEKDTLMIIDGSFMRGTYTLSNGKEISTKLASKIVLQKKSINK